MPDALPGFRMAVVHHEPDPAAATLAFILFPALTPDPDGKGRVLAGMGGKIQRNFRIVAARFLRRFHIQNDPVFAVRLPVKHATVQFPLIRSGELRRKLSIAHSAESKQEKKVQKLFHCG